MSTRTTRRLSALLLALALPLAGCSGDDDEPSSGQFPATSDAPSAPTGAAASDGGSYPTTDAVVAALVDAGVPCEEPQQGTFEGVSDAQSCIVGGAEDVVVLRFATPEEKQGYLAGKDELSSTVLGQDWAIQTVLLKTAQDLQAALGGELLAGPTS